MENTVDIVARSPAASLASLMAKLRACSLEVYLKQSTKKRQKDTTYAIM